VLCAERRHGISRWVHEKARPIAMAWVILVTAFSLVTQAIALGYGGARLAACLEISPAVPVLVVAATWETSGPTSRPSSHRHSEPGRYAASPFGWA
jgi:hypothetical protein